MSIGHRPFGKPAARSGRRITRVRRWTRIVVLMSVLASVQGPATTSARQEMAGGILIAHDGRAHAQIVLSPGRPREEAAAELRAAELLREWVELMTDVRLPIVRYPTSVPTIRLGQAAVDHGLALDDVASASTEAIRVLADDSHVLIGAQSSAALIKAVATLLEHLGCRWYIDSPLGRQYPRSPTLRIAPLDISAKPGFRMRRIWSGEGWSRPTLWKQWNGMGGLPYRFNHSWRMFSEQDFEAHPEWFARGEDGDRRYGRWLNTGNMDLRAEFARRLEAQIEPGEHVSIAPPDRIEPDTSEESVRLDVTSALEPMSQRVSMSDRFFAFANDIALRIGSRRPESLLGFLAYSDYSQPPRRIRRLEPNLCVWLAPYRYSRYHRIGDRSSPSRNRLRAEIDRWTEIASCLGYRPYGFNIGEAMTPFPKLSTWSHDIPHVASRDFVGISIEAFPSWDLAAPGLYLATRLSYAPDSDPTQILDDFYRGFYGPAWLHMKRYWESVDSAWSELETESGSIYSVHLAFTDQRLRLNEGHLSAAERVTRDDPELLARVAMARNGHQNAVDFVAVRRSLLAGDLDEAIARYDGWLARTQAAAAAGTGHIYSVRYLEAFVGAPLEALREVLASTASSRITLRLPDRMRLAYQSDVVARGGRAWQEVRTYSATLEQQGIDEKFDIMWYQTSVSIPAFRRILLVLTAIDGTTRVAIGGNAVTRGESATDVAVFDALRPATVDITSLATPGVNEFTFRVDHRFFRRMKLGGIVGPVFLIIEPAGD